MSSLTAGQQALAGHYESFIARVSRELNPGQRIGKDAVDAINSILQVTEFKIGTGAGYSAVIANQKTITLKNMTAAAQVVLSGGTLALQHAFITAMQGALSVFRDAAAEKREETEKARRTGKPRTREAVGARAGFVFPVTRVTNSLKQNLDEDPYFAASIPAPLRISEEAAVCLTVLLELICRHILQKAAAVTVARGAVTVQKLDVYQAILRHANTHATLGFAIVDEDALPRLDAAINKMRSCPGKRVKVQCDRS